MEYKIQELDFVERTKEIIDRDNEEKYEVTLLLNCLVGLIIIPQQKWFGKLSKDMVSEAWGIKPEDISFIRAKENKDIETVARHIRNSMSHYRFTAFSNDEKEIDRIEFKDFLEPQNITQTFKAVITIKNLKKFTNKLSDEFIKEIKKAKGIK